MIWFFCQGRAQIDLEVCRLGEPGSYHLVVTYPDGSERLERFPDPRALVARVVELEDHLIAQGWSPGGVTSDATLGPVGEPPLEGPSPRRLGRRPR